MSRFATSGRATIAGTSALPLVSLYGTTGVRPRIVQVSIWNTTAVAAVFALVRLSTTGTPGAGLAETAEDHTPHVAIATAFAGHTVGPTIGGEIERATLGAAIGSAVIWTFAGLEIDNLTTAGVGIIVPTSTGQIVDYTIKWDE
jgi:hypothetical protein